VFQQKITDDQRVLATVLYQRKLCTQDTLAELFEVSRPTIGDVVREVGPIPPKTASPHPRRHPVRHRSRDPRRARRRRAHRATSRLIL
jgi:hypothetical protein